MVCVVTVSVSAFQVEVLHTNPAPLQAGEYADITVQIVNPAQAKNQDEVTFFIKDTAHITPVDGQQATIGSIQRGSFVTRTFTVFVDEQVPAGFYPLYVVVQQQGVQTEYQQRVYIQSPLFEPQLAVGSLNSYPNHLLPDSKQNIVEVMLQNLGDKTADVIEVTLHESSGIIKQSHAFSLTDSLSRLEGGQQEQVSFTFDIEPVVGLSDIPAELQLRYRYRDARTNQISIRTIALPIHIPISQTPYFDVETKQDNLRAGQSDTHITVHLTNVGAYQGEQVRLRLFPNPAQPFDFDQTAFFVTPYIDVNQEMVLRIPFDVLKDAALQEHVIKAQLESMVGTSVFTQQIYIPIVVQQEALSTLQTNAWRIIIAALIIALLLGWMYKKTREDN
ncbi:MAG: COG1361 S-layer family protein [Candidatus Woesearchaeota archaeon]